VKVEEVGGWINVDLTGEEGRIGTERKVDRRALGEGGELDFTDEDKIEKLFGDESKGESTGGKKVGVDFLFLNFEYG
jgi:hypothetical protein